MVCVHVHAHVHAHSPTQPVDAVQSASIVDSEMVVKIPNSEASQFSVVGFACCLAFAVLRMFVEFAVGPGVSDDKSE